jgi:hypothetical protein
LGELEALVPQEMIDFYIQVAGFVEVEFWIDRTKTARPTDSFEGFETRTTPSIITGGLEIVDPAEFPEIREGILETAVGFIRPRRPGSEQKKEFVTALARKAIPIARLYTANCIVMIPDSEIIPSGVYLLFLDQLTEEISGIRLAPTFSQWLEFLEQSCYIEPRWNFREFWHAGDAVHVNPKHTERLLEFMWRR